MNESSAKLNENLEALKHNFLFRGYYRRLEREEKEQKK
jgi:phospholipid/cholesterol/gamma-HCH transport system substrate-binding protein